MKLTLFAVSHPTGKLKTFINFYNSFALFCLLIYLCLNKQTVKQFYDNTLCSPLRELIYI